MCHGFDREKETRRHRIDEIARGFSLPRHCGLAAKAAATGLEV